MMILRFQTTRLLRRLPRRIRKDLKLPSKVIRSPLKNLSNSLASPLLAMVLSRRTKLDNKRETISPEVVAIEEAAEVEVANGVKPLETPVVVAEVVNSIRDPEPLTRLMLRETKLSRRTTGDQEAIEETEVIAAASTRAWTDKMALVEAAEVAERMEADLLEMLPLMMLRKRPRSRSPLLRPPRNLSLNMKKSFLVKTSMIISVPSRPLVARRLPELLRRLMLLLSRTPPRRYINKLPNRTNT